MLSFLFLLIIFILVISFIVISTVLGLLRSVFSFGKRNNLSSDFTSQDDRPTAVKSKIFDKDEGEYVDYEEIK
jgi:hypothetical protein